MTAHPAAPTAAHDEVASAASTSTAPARFTRAGLLTVLVCWLLVVFDGYDLIVYGTVQTTLIETTGWGLTKATAGTVGSVAFAGMLVGAILAGRLSDSLGRKRAVLGCAVVFSVFTIACAFAPNAPVFGILRFLAGVGLGGLVPSANALAAGVVPARWRAMVATLMMSGVPIGGSIAALSGIVIIPAWGWQGMFLVAVLPLIFLIPLGVKYLPDLRSHANSGRRHRLPSNPPRPVPRRQPGVRRRHHGHPLRLVRTRHLAARTDAAGRLQPRISPDFRADPEPGRRRRLHPHRLGRRPVRLASHRCGRSRVAAAALLTIVAAPPVGVVYAMLVLAGIGTHGTQCLIIAAVAGHYPDHLRGTALGWALGIGRIGAVAAPQVGGWMLAAGLGVNSNFIAFALAAGIAAALIALAWRLTGKRGTGTKPVLAR